MSSEPAEIVAAAAAPAQQINPFPLLELPEDVFLKLYPHFTCPEIINLAFTSKRMMYKMGDCKQYRKRSHLHVLTGLRDAVLSVELADQQYFTWFIKKILPTQPAQPRVRQSERWEDSVPEEDFLVKVTSMLYTMTVFFSDSIAHISLATDAKSFEWFILGGNSLHCAKQYAVGPRVYTDEEMTYLLDNIDADEFICWGKTSRRFVYEKPLEFPEMEIVYATWINIEMVKRMSLTSRRIDLGDTTLISDKDINGFIKFWLTSDMEQLKFVRFARSWPKYSHAVVLEGIEGNIGKKRSLPERPQHVHNIAYGDRNYEIPFEHGCDIFRKDGLAATVLIVQMTSKKDFLGFECIFAVWDDDKVANTLNYYLLHRAKK